MLAALIAGLGLSPDPAWGQPRPGAGQDLVDLALAWAQGDFRSPLICEFEGRPRRGLRRVRIVPVRRTALQRTDEIVFHDLDPEGANRCFTELGGDQANWIGAVRISLEARSRPDTAMHDFQSRLRRDGGITFAVKSGSLRRIAIGSGEERVVRFAGGRATLSRIPPGSDTARLLAEFRARRKLRLALESPDGVRLELPLVELPAR